MSNLIAQIQAAQRDAGERAVIAHLSTTMGALRIEKPDDLLTVANIELDGSTLTLLANDLGNFVDIAGEQEATYTLRIGAMRRDEFESLPDFNGF